MPTITISGETITPQLLEDATTQATSNTRVHELIGGNRRYTLRPATPRAGTLTLFFLDRAEAWNCYTLHTQPAVASLVDDENPERSMSYVTAGAIEPALDDASREHWHVMIDYAEVLS